MEKDEGRGVEEAIEEEEKEGGPLEGREEAEVEDEEV